MSTASCRIGRGRRGLLLSTHSRQFLDLQFLDLLPIAAYVCDREGFLVHCNPRAVELWGRRPRPKQRFCGALRLYRPDGSPLPRRDSPMAEALRTGASLRDRDVVIERPDRSRTVAHFHIAVLRDDGGEVTGAISFVMAQATASKPSDEVAAHLAAIVQSSHDAIISNDLSGTVTSWNRAAQRLFGYTAEEAVGRSIAILYPPDRLEEETFIIERIRRGQQVETYESVRRRKDGNPVDVSLTVSPMRDCTGVAIGASAIVRDITEKKRADEQRELLLGEMNHRVKNLFALCNAIVARSKRSARSIEDMAQAIEGRLRALACAHNLTFPMHSHSGDATDRTTTFEDILRAIVAPHVDPTAEERRVVSQGPEVPVSGEAVAHLSLLLHELTTNASKYGALSSDSGRIEVRWNVCGSRLLLSWRERGGPALSGPPHKEGFGSLLARQIVTAPLGGAIAYDWHREGLGIEIAIAADRLTPG
jgi:PAS domain S-box-containing protein